MKRKLTQSAAVGDWCAALTAVTIDNTFGDQTDVFRIGNKMFALLNGDASTLTVKTPPSESVALQEKYSSVTPGYYMNKTHWITIDLNGNVPPSVTL